ncbi:hypothetical protein [Clostridium tunisiense]|uniref:hypothetical protein n=1 Tax=Clostridium tunisiense TaxID=219748 RepID=UPI0002F2D1A8|nr:hypothetical protein [Clostridium tunisiense]
MCGCGNQRFNFQPCTILLVIAILGNQGLLNDSPTAKNALTLLLLYWLCGCNNNNASNVAPYRENRCKCRRRKVKVCCC